jgi:hypothetical protein
VSELFANYIPRDLPAETWDAVRDFVVGQVGRLDEDTETVRKQLSALAYLAGWCYGEHVPLDVE